MKQAFLLTSFILLILGNLKAHEGVFYSLTECKNIVEHKAMTILSTKSDSEKVVMADQYIKLKSFLDAIINQFEYEISVKNGLAKKFKTIDYAFKKSKKVKSKSEINTFYDNLIQYIQACNDFYPTPKGGKLSVVPDLTGSVADLVGTGWGIYKDIKDMRAKRVEDLSNLLNSIRLSPLKDLQPSKE